VGVRPASAIWGEIARSALAARPDDVDGASIGLFAGSLYAQIE
jgi:hypothetical protein